MKNIGEIGETQAFRGSSELRLSRVPTIAAMEGALIEMRDLEWRSPGAGGPGAGSPFAKDGPWHLAQREVGDIAGEYSETLLTNESGKELQVRKLDTLRPRTPLTVAEVDRLECLRGWLQLLPDGDDRRIVWEASFNLWRGEAFDWAAIKRRTRYPHSTQRLGFRYREAVAKLVCRVNGVPVRHHRALMARDSQQFNSAARRVS